jgi:hypothetical protein
VKKVRVNSSILAARETFDGSLEALVGREGVVVEYNGKYKIVQLDGGGTFPFESHELTEVRNAKL